MKQYTGPDALYIRTILAPFADDPDWLLPAIPLVEDSMWSTPGVRRGTMAPLKGLAISFAFVTATNIQLRGGTCDAYAYVLKTPKAFGLPDGAAMLRERIGVWSGHDMNEPLVADVSKYAAMGIRLSNIAAPVGAAKLALCVQEIDPA